LSRLQEYIEAVGFRDKKEISSIEINDKLKAFIPDTNSHLNVIIQTKPQYDSTYRTFGALVSDENGVAQRIIWNINKKRWETTS